MNVNIWVCRPGKLPGIVEQFQNNGMVTCPWQGFNSRWDNKDKQELLEMVSRVKHVEQNSVSARNWVAQMMNFSNDMKVNDYVITPYTDKKIYILGVIKSRYQFNQKACDEMKHFHEVQWIRNDLSKNMFSIDLIHTLGAYRTVFRIKKENQIKQIVEEVNKRGYY